MNFIDTLPCTLIGKITKRSILIDDRLGVEPEVILKYKTRRPTK